MAKVLSSIVSPHTLKHIGKYLVTLKNETSGLFYWVEYYLRVFWTLLGDGHMKKKKKTEKARQIQFRDFN